MITFRVERTIARPRAEVFARLADVDAYRSWLPTSVIFRGGAFTAPGTNPRRNVAYVEKTPLGSFPGRIVAYEPPAMIALQTPMILMGRCVFESRPRYVLDEADGATVVHHFAEGEFYGPWRVFEPGGRRLARYERTRIMDALTRSFAAGG